MLCPPPRNLKGLPFWTQDNLLLEFERRVDFIAVTFCYYFFFPLFPGLCLLSALPCYGSCELIAFLVSYCSFSVTVDMTPSS